MTSDVPIVLERDNVNDDSVILARWIARHGDKVEVGALLAEVETSKAVMEVYSPAAGYLAWEFPESAEVPVSSAIGYISAEPLTAVLPVVRCSDNHADAVSRQIANFPAAALSIDAAAHKPNIHTPTVQGLEFPSTKAYSQRFSPLAAKLMNEHGLTAADFSGKSMVRKQDVEDYLNSPTEALAATIRGGTPVAAARITQPYTEVPLSKMKRNECSTLAAGARNVLQSVVTIECFTRGLRRILETGTFSANASAVIVYEVSRLLRKYPTLNATYRSGAMLEYEQVNVGYAMDDDRCGLKVAVLQNSDSLSLHEIAEKMRDLTVAYLEDKLTPVQTTNPTFIVSDLSGMGVSSFYPLISENQGGILGVGGEQFAPGSPYGTYKLILAFDHQLSNGRSAARFLNDLKGRLQSYESMSSSMVAEMTCTRCGRTAAQLAGSNQYLLRSVMPEGYLCSLCVAGN